MIFMLRAFECASAAERLARAYEFIKSLSAEVGCGGLTHHLHIAIDQIGTLASRG